MKQSLLTLTTLLLAPLAALRAADQAVTDLPSFRYHGVILEAAKLKYRPHDDVIYPSVVRVGSRIPGAMSPCFIQADGRWYMFFNIGPRLRNKIALAISEPLAAPAAKP